MLFENLPIDDQFKVGNMLFERWATQMHQDIIHPPRHFTLLDTRRASARLELFYRAKQAFDTGSADLYIPPWERTQVMTLVRLYSNWGVSYDLKVHFKNKILKFGILLPRIRTKF